jgi:DNA polymerase-3 subunit epsilon
MSKEFAVIDFETTGLGAEYCRVIEVAAVIVRDGEVSDSFVQLMNPGRRLPFYIKAITGISDEMLVGKPSPEIVMPELMRFLGDRPCIAHKASFDSSFYHAEMNRAGIAHERSFFCTMLLSRRLIQDSPDHQLGTLTDYLDIPKPNAGSCHRALYDALLTVELWKHIEKIICEKVGGRAPDHEIYRTLMRIPKAAAWEYLEMLKK